MPRTGGGGMTRTLPPATTPKDWRNSWAITSAALRSPNGFKGMNIAPALGAVEKVAPSRPAKATVAWVDGFFIAIALTRSMISEVRWSDEPGGSWMTAIR